MRVTESVHAVRTPFAVTTAGGASVSRFVYAYLIFGERICLVDSGVANSEHAIFEYIRAMGRSPEELSHLVLTHSHPDHIGSARAIREGTGCAVCAHPAEKRWIEDIDSQARERPVPGFHALVGGSVGVDRTLENGARLPVGRNRELHVLHTPGHSRGSISLCLRPEGALFTGDAVLLPGDIPIYEDVASLIRSMKVLMGLEEIEILLSSWGEPRLGKDIAPLYRGSLGYLRRIHETVLRNADPSVSPMEMCVRVLGELGLPGTIANPLTAASFGSHLEAHEKGIALFED